MFSRTVAHVLQAALVVSALPLACSDEVVRVTPSTPGVDAPATEPAQDDAAYPAGPAMSADACARDHAAAYRPSAPATCTGRRTCVDGRGRFWLRGAPFFPRGAYNNGADYKKLLGNCPTGETCKLTTPKDADAYVRMLADAGLNLVQERSRFAGELLEAIHREPRVHIAHLLWSDPFTAEGHDAMVRDVEAAAADGDVVMWFGPDEVDLNAGFAMAAGIRRVLRGASPALDALLAGRYAAGAGAYLPVGEPPHDPHGLPYGAAMAFDRGLREAPNVYDVSMPITYPFTALEDAPANAGEWGTWRASSLSLGLPVVPVLQMVGIPSMGLAHPRADQVRGLVASSLVHGARGAFYYTLIGDAPRRRGRAGWFAADDTEAWAAYREMHALEDALLPAIFASSEERVGERGGVEWRTFVSGVRRVVLVVNPTPSPLAFDLDAAVARAPTERVRGYLDCAAVTTRAVTLPAYAFALVEVLPAAP